MTEKAQFKLGALLALTTSLITNCHPVSAQYFMGAEADPGVAFQRDWAVTHPSLPPLSQDIPDCLVGPHLPFERLSGKLALTDEQHMALYNFDHQCLNKVEPMLAQMHSTERDIESQMATSNLDPNKVRQLQKQLYQQRQNISDVCLDNQLNVLGVLTADQRQGLQALIAKEHSPFWHHRW